MRNQLRPRERLIYSVKSGLSNEDFTALRRFPRTVRSYTPCLGCFPFNQSPEQWIFIVIQSWKQACPLAFFLCPQVMLPFRSSMFSYTLYKWGNWRRFCLHKAYWRTWFFHPYVCVYVCVRQVASVMSDSVRSHGVLPTRVLCPWDFPSKNTEVGCHFLLQGILPMQGSNPSLLRLLH